MKPRWLGGLTVGPFGLSSIKSSKTCKYCRCYECTTVVFIDNESVCIECNDLYKKVLQNIPAVRRMLKHINIGGNDE